MIGFLRFWCFLFCQIDLVTKEEKQTVIAAIRQMNKDAVIIEAEQCSVDLKSVVNTGLFEFEKAERNTKWLGDDRFNFVPETIEYGITNFIYQRKRPFHNHRLYKLFDKNFLCYLRPFVMTKE